MSERIRGRLVTDVTYQDEHGTHRTGLVGYHISVHFFGLHEGGWAVGTGRTDSLGFYEFDYKRRTPGEGWLEIEARDRTGRLLPFLTGDGSTVPRWLVADAPVETLPMLDLVILDKEATGLQVTLGTGQASGYSIGNEVRLLVDNEQFSRTAELVKASQHRVLMTQLYFQVPEEFKNVAMEESPKLVFDFHLPDLDQPRAVEPSDDRLERLIHTAALRGVPTRILLHSIHRPWFRKLLLAMLVYPIQGSDGVRWAFTGLGGKVASLDDVRRYFDVAQAALEVEIRGFGHDPAFDNGAMHAKLLQVDNYSICFGAPFGPSYTDTTEHLIDAWVRGADTGLPKHSVGFEAFGPVFADWYSNIFQLWQATDGDPLPPYPKPDEGGEIPPTPPPAPHTDADAVCDIQVVRTLAPDVLAGHLDGEKGVLEAYLRAFNLAEDFIYLENQCFTSEAIAKALVEVMKGHPTLQVIMLLPIKPDPPGHPRKQRRLIDRVRDDLAEVPGALDRFGVFTRWTHEPPGPASTRPRIVPVHIHSKVGIVDQIWATVGSANLDGLSLDAAPGWFGRNLLGRDKRSLEVNASLINQDWQEHSMARAIRRRLWCEHLGLTHLPDRPIAGWLTLWNDRAAQTLQQLRQHPSQPWSELGNVLPWPPPGKKAYDEPADHLRSLEVEAQSIAALKSTRAFDLRAGQWKPGKPTVDA